jgi:Phosphate-induced protein 1 conserved region
MKKQCLGIALTACLASCVFAQNSSPIHVLRPFHPGTLSNTGCYENSPCEITYFGGPVFEAVPTIYIIYYGNWTARDKSIIDNFFAHLGGTPMAKINTTYSDSNSKFVPDGLNYDPAKNSYHDNYSLGKRVADAQIQQIVANAISSGQLPNDTNGIYFVLTYSDVSVTPGECQSWCGYHGPSTSIVSGETIKYVMAGNPARCPSECGASAVIGDGNKSPNNDPGADGTVNIIWHEFSESVTDPEVNLSTVWDWPQCGEAGDCCAWSWGKTHIAKNGSHYNQTVGGKRYLTQMILELTTTQRGKNEPGKCQNTFQKP